MIPNAIQTVASGQKVARLTLLDEIKKSPDSSVTRIAITSANKYALITGNYNAEYLKLTQDSALITSPDIGKLLFDPSAHLRSFLVCSGG